MDRSQIENIADALVMIFCGRIASQPDNTSFKLWSYAANSNRIEEQRSTGRQ